MALVYYAIILIYPIIVAFLSKFMFDSDLKSGIKNAYYLLAGYILIYIAILLIVLSTTRFINPIVNLIFFSIGYFAIFFIRSYIQTDTHDIFASSPTE
jgi:quinol-cytochrome oxidoreductase complex cytochrome b subunit